MLQIITGDPLLAAGMSAKAKGLFPAFLPETDETRDQGLHPLLRIHRGTTFFISEKQDGTSLSATVSSVLPRGDVAAA